MSYYKEHLVSPDDHILEGLADFIWASTLAENRTPLVLLTTSGPAYGLRQALENRRPRDLPLQLVFLPRVMSLGSWLNETIGLKSLGAQKSDIERWLDVYRALSERPQLNALLLDSTEASKWALAKNIVEVCDLLSDASLGLTDVISEETFMTAIQAVYRGASRQIVELETRIILAFWENLSGQQDPVFRQRKAMNLRLDEAMHAIQPSPIIYIESANPSPGFQKAATQFLQAYAKKTTVHHCIMDYSKIALWPECLDPKTTDLMNTVQQNQAQYFDHQNTDAPFNRRIFKASHFEDSAWQGAGAIEQLLQDGHRHIALIAQDRLVARRMRALLTRFGPGLSVHDETGWKLSTTRAAASVMSWLDVVRQPLGPSASELMDFLKNPYIDWSVLGFAANEISEHLEFLENLLIESDVRGSWIGLQLALSKKSEEASKIHALILQLKTLSQAWSKSSQDCKGWFDLLESDLLQLGMLDSLKKDMAGLQLIQTLLPMKSLTRHQLKQSEWLALLGTMIEEASYIEASPRAAASITILPLSATRLRRFDAWVMVGCDDSQLPSLSESPMFLSASIKQLLGCKTQEMEFAQQARDLSQLMMSHQYWRMIWQATGPSGEPRQASPWLQRLYLHRPDFLKETLKKVTREYEPKPSHMPAPSLPGNFVKPEAMSPSAYRTLRECPYRYYVTRLLGLRERNTLDAEVDLSLVGQTLHASLRDFYHGLKTNPIESDNSFEKIKRLRQRLYAISYEHFKPLLEVDGRWLAAWIEWESLIPEWIQWQVQREEAGWVFHDGEKPVGFNLETSHGPFQVRGFVDRLDIHPEQGVAVIDYKYSSKTSISKKKDRIKDDPQLVIYAKAIDGQDMVGQQSVSVASWVSLKEADTVIQVDDLVEHMNELPVQMIADIEALWGGAGIQASAPDSICQYCQARGICRKGMWS
jgi:ATP-dependent helicase/nuclease subunit B